MAIRSTAEKRRGLAGETRGTGEEIVVPIRFENLLIDCGAGRRRADHA